MSTLSISLALSIRIVLVLLFLPFSALDKVLDFRGAVAQAREAISNTAVATGLIWPVCVSRCSCRLGLSQGLRIVPAHSCSLATVPLPLCFGSNSGAPAIFGVRTTGKAVRCSGIS